MILASFVIAGLLAGCASAPPAVPNSPVAKVERVDGAFTRITLTAKAAQRIGIQTAPVNALAGETMIPYGALIYDTKGDTFTYTNPESLVYVRHSVRVKQVRGDQVVLADGPPAGAVIVTVGASQLLGIELGIGS